MRFLAFRCLVRRALAAAFDMAQPLPAVDPALSRRVAGDRDSGFTLIETVVAVAILGLLAAAMFPLAAAFVDVTFVQSTEDELNRVAVAIEHYFEDVGGFPAALVDLEVKPSGVAGWCGPYLLPAFVADAATNDDYRFDAWRNPYQVLITSASVRTLRSRGSNGVDDGGSGDDIERVIDASPILRAATVAEIQCINAAIVSYNVDHLPDDLLPGEWSSAITTLQAAGLLPAGAAAALEYRYDAWGREYVPSAQPMISVTSLGPP